MHNADTHDSSNFAAASGRVRHLRMLAAGALLCMVPSLSEAAGAPDPHDLSGVWQIQSYSAKINPGVTAVVLTPAGQAAYDKNVAGLKNGSVVDAARKSCAPDGVPRVMGTPYPFQIMPAAGRLTMRFEVNSETRTIALDKPMPAAAQLTPADMGNSFGHWDGDTLIIESAGFTDKTFLDATGLPHSDQLRVTEYLWKTDGGKELQYVAIVEDPKMFTQIWAERFIYRLRPDIRLANYVCGGKNRDISGVKGAAEWK